MTMASSRTPKQIALEMIERMPDTATFDDLMEGLAVCQQIEEGLADVEAGRVVPHDEAMRQVSDFLDTLNVRPLSSGKGSY